MMARNKFSFLQSSIGQHSKGHQSPATRSYIQEQAVKLYREAGFKDIQVFHEFTFEPVKPEDDTFCVLGFKPKLK